MSAPVSIGAAARGVVEGLRPARAGVETWAVTDRAAWLARRAQDVTASAAGALLGVHDYLTAYQLHALKAGLVSEDPEETPPMVRGRLLEPVALQLLREQRPAWKIWTPGAYWRDPAARLGATPDALALDETGALGVVQIKTVEPSVFRRKWRDEDGGVEPPLWIAVQAMIEAHLVGATWAAVAAMRVGFGLDFDVVLVPLHARLIARVEQEVAAFWRGVESGLPPDPDYARDGATIAALYAPDDSLPPADMSGWNELPEMVAEREEIAERTKAGTARRKEIDARIRDRLAGATVGVMADGRVITNKLQTRREHVVAASTFPVLKISKGAA